MSSIWIQAKYVYTPCDKQVELQTNRLNCPTIHGLENPEDVDTHTQHRKTSVLFDFCLYRSVYSAHTQTHIINLPYVTPTHAHIPVTPPKPIKQPQPMIAYCILYVCIEAKVRVSYRSVPKLHLGSQSCRGGWYSVCVCVCVYAGSDWSCGSKLTGDGLGMLVEPHPAM